MASVCPWFVVRQRGFLLSAYPFHFLFSLTRNFMCYCHFRRIRICIEECPLDSSFLSVRLSSLPHASARFTLDQFPWNLIFATLRKYAEEPQIGYNRTKVSDIIPEDQSTFVLLTAVRDFLYLYSSVRKTPVLSFHGNSQRFYIVDSYQQVNNNIKGKHNCVSIAKIFTRMHHLVRCTCVACPVVYGVWFVIHAVGIKRILFFCNSFEVNPF